MATGTVTRPRVLAEVQTYRSDTCTNGHRIEVRSDNTLRITSVAYWRGSTCGTVWITPPIPELGTLAALEAHRDEDPHCTCNDCIMWQMGEMPSVDAAVCNWLEAHPDWQDDARRIRRGVTVR